MEWYGFISNLPSRRKRLYTLKKRLPLRNGAFPTLIAIITMFFTGAVSIPFQSALSALWLMGVIVLGVGMTLLVSRVLSKTLLKGVPSSFALELPPYRCPQFGKVLVRSIFDRTLFVLGRAVTVAAPAGLIIWLLANIQAGDASLLAHCAAFFDPFGRLIGLDGLYPGISRKRDCDSAHYHDLPGKRQYGRYVEP